MRSFPDYSARDWMQMRPLVDAVKLGRNFVAERLYRTRRSAELANFLAANSHLHGRTVAIAVAFNTPWAIELVIRSARANLVEATLIVVDNSTEPGARREICSLCARYGVACLPLPSNPVRHVSRSHGVALTWTYYNVVRSLRPAVFAFLDHDLFALRPVDLAACVRDQPVYGRSAPGAHGWNIWAGYCVFDFAAVSRFPLDFNTDRPRGLDTGGRNWKRLYRHLDAGRIRLAESRQVTAVDPETGERFTVEMIDGFAHYAHAAFVDAVDPARRDFFTRLVSRAEAGQNLDDVLETTTSGG